MTDEVVGQISERYIELYEVVTGKTFQKQDVNYGDIENKLIAALEEIQPGITTATV